jgi:hypothetical protein
MLIAEYFAEFVERIETCPLVSAKQVTLDARSDYTGIIRGEIFFFDETVLYFTEVVDVEITIERVKYRYQYQHFDTRERIFRYDNARHHPNLPTFPHHKHVGPEADPETVNASPECFFEEILDEIEQRLYHANLG